MASNPDWLTSSIRKRQASMVMAQPPQSINRLIRCRMAGRECAPPLVKRHGDIILFQRISGGWEYRYTNNGGTYRGFHRDSVLARTRLFRQLGWDRQRFESAEFKRF
jgi:hypothetical protein